MIIEIAYCEDCGTDWRRQTAQRARKGLPRCPLCGSARLSHHAHARILPRKSIASSKI
jgi:hypothetical protein